MGVFSHQVVVQAVISQFVLNVFYGTIVVENEHYIPKNGEPVIICSNHTNSLTDALLLVTSVSSKRRNFLRLTAKDTQFGKPTFQSWLIEKAGTVPIQRRTEHAEGVNNQEVMARLYRALEDGDAICLFPEGMSRFHPTMAPLKTGVARIASDVLSRNANDPEFAVTILTCSLTYVHRQSFRSDVLVSFNPPLRLTVKDNPDLISTPEHAANFDTIKSLTLFMHAQLSSNTIDAPSWDLVRVAKAAARIYVPLGTRMRLGDWVRVVARFVEGFSVGTHLVGEGRDEIDIQRKGMVRTVSWRVKTTAPRVALANDIVSVVPTEDAHEATENTSMGDQERQQLSEDITAYQNHLNDLGLKDDRIRQYSTITTLTVLWKLLIRLAQTALLLIVATPGLTLWLPVLATTTYYTRKLKSSGPVWDTYDEVAQTKLIYGLASGLGMCATASLIGILGFGLKPFFVIFFVPAWMWLTLRWTEDLMAAFRAVVALWRLLRIEDRELKRTGASRAGLGERITSMASHVLGLPLNPEREFLVVDGEDGDETPSRWGKHQRGRTRGGWDSAMRYFSIRRRRKRDWNETLRWFDATDFPKDR